MQRETSPIPGPFIHMVYFWLKDSTDVEDFKRRTTELARGIGEVISYHVGEPAGTPREVVDNSYTVCLVATFASKEDQNIYQDHPIHQQYVEDNKDKWTRVQVYDSWAG